MIVPSCGRVSTSAEWRARAGVVCRRCTHSCTCRAQEHSCTCRAQEHSCTCRAWPCPRPTAHLAEPSAAHHRRVQPVCRRVLQKTTTNAQTHANTQTHEHRGTHICHTHSCLTVALIRSAVSSRRRNNARAWQGACNLGSARGGNQAPPIRATTNPSETHAPHAHLVVGVQQLPKLLKGAHRVPAVAARP